MTKPSLFVAVLSVVACRGNAPAPTAAPAPAPEAIAAPAAAPVVANGSIKPATDVRSLLGRLQYEAQHRPTTAVNADHVLDVIDQAGLKLERRRQYLGSTVKAAYCIGGTTSDGVAVSACEYPTPAAAAEGLAYMNGALKNTQLAKREQHASTVLSIANHDARSDGLVHEAFNQFSAL
jgi:hypothetical protein